MLQPAKDHGSTVIRVTSAQLKPVRSMRHHPRSSPHQFADGARKRHGAGALRLSAMPGFVVTHGLDDRAAARVFTRQALQMTLQMPLDLAFGLGNEPEARAITQ